jgi:hypothetical protein
MRERKLRSSVNWEDALKRKRLGTGVKQGLHVFTFKMLHTQSTKVIAFRCCHNLCKSQNTLLLLLEALQLQRSFGLLSEFLPFDPVSDAVLPDCYFHPCYIALYIIFPSIFRSS